MTTVKKDSKLKVYRHFMERAMEKEDWEGFEFWSKAFDTEWNKIYSKGIKKVDKYNIWCYTIYKLKEIKER